MSVTETLLSFVGTRYALTSYPTPSLGDRPSNKRAHPSFAGPHLLLASPPGRTWSANRTQSLQSGHKYNCQHPWPLSGHPCSHCRAKVYCRPTLVDEAETLWCHCVSCNGWTRMTVMTVRLHRLVSEWDSAEVSLIWANYTLCVLARALGARGGQTCFWHFNSDSHWLKIT